MRKAARIELHDVPIILNTEDEDEPLHGWSHECAAITREIYDLEGHNLHTLMLRFYPFILGDMPVAPANTQFLRSVTPVAGSRNFGGYHIAELWANPRTRNLLDIKVVKSYDVIDGDDYVHEHQITYSGSYTIWWAWAEEEE